MVSFYPGPSRVYDEIPRYVREAQGKGILSLNHRSPEFEALTRKTVLLLKRKLRIPAAYAVVFTSSATECWEMISQSLVVEESIHIHCGAFGEKWHDYARRLKEQSHAVPFDRESNPDPSALIFQKGDVICLTQNETSNGTQVAQPIIDSIRRNNPRHLIAVDATSSMAGIHLDFAVADVWFASVQKCFGLPAGLGVMVLSPKALDVVRKINEGKHYNSLSFVLQMMERWQTPCTPNVLGMYLLMRTLEARPGIGEVHALTVKRAKAWQAFLDQSRAFNGLIRNAAVRSYTVMAVQAVDGQIDRVKQQALKNGFLLGEGYGLLKKDTFRIANFPALRQPEIDRLRKFLSVF